MKRIGLILAVITAMFLSCGPDGKPGTSDLYYYDVKSIVVQAGTDIAPDHSKFHNPTEYHILLCRMITCKVVIPKANGAKKLVTDTTLFTEYEATASRYYSTEVGDTLTWEYINKDRWFQIKKK
jgi:hypothetical protein